MDKAVKYDEGKLDWAILPIEALEEVIKALQYGEAKYSRSNFAVGEGLSYTRILGSLLRHTTKFMVGEDNDPDSGLNHIAHAAANTLILLHYITHKERFTKNDDRFTNILR